MAISHEFFISSCYSGILSDFVFQLICIKMDLREIGWDGMDWIDLPQDRDHWMALLNTVINFWFHKMLGNSWVAAQLAASQGLSFMSELCPNLLSEIWHTFLLMKCTLLSSFEFFICFFKGLSSVCFVYTHFSAAAEYFASALIAYPFPFKLCGHNLQVLTDSLFWSETESFMEAAKAWIGL
jgi:hypothetical protein